MIYTLFKHVLLFFIYGTLGWCTEVAFAALKSGRFVNRGFLNGPICPIYGFGIVGVVTILAPWNDNLLLLWLGSFVLTTLIELLTGFFLERIFHAKWWDYSRMPLNIGGYVCLPFSMIWGAACLAVVHWIHPIIEKGVMILPAWLLYSLSGLLLSVIILDVVATVTTIIKLTHRLEGVTRLSKELHSLSDFVGEEIYEKTIATKKLVEEGYNRLEKEKEHLEARRDVFISKHESQIQELVCKQNALLTEKKRLQKRLVDAFPNMKSNRYNDALNKLREKMLEQRKKKSDK